MMQNEKLQRSSEHIIMFTDEECLFRKKFDEELENNKLMCTICAKITDKSYPHPILKVIVCFDCLKSYESTEFTLNKNGTDKNCRWCGEKTKKYHCALCTMVFCKNCLERNFGTKYIRKLESRSWDCFICEPKALWRLRAICSKAMDNNDNRETQSMTIDLSLNQDVHSNHLSLSEQVLVDSEREQFISEIDLDINNTEKTNVNVMSDSNSSMCSFKIKQVPVSSVLNEAEEDLNSFLQLFSLRVEQFSQKFKSVNVNSCDQAEKLVNKISVFCDKAIENIQGIKQKSVQRLHKWKINNETHKLSTPKTNVELNCNIQTSSTTKANSETLPVKQVAKKNTSKKKFNLSLKLVENKFSDDESLLKKENEKLTSDLNKNIIHKTKIPNNEQELNSVSQEEVQIKEENSDNFDKETEICEKENLQTRIEEDFGNESIASNNAVCIETYLCDQTGEFCQSYSTVNEDSSDNSDVDTSGKNCNFSDLDNESDKNDGWDWFEVFQKENNEDRLTNNSNTDEYSPENFKMTTTEEEILNNQSNNTKNNDKELDDKVNISENTRSEQISDSELTSSSKTEEYTPENSNMLNEKQNLENQISCIENNKKELDEEICNSETTSDLEYKRQVAFESLLNDSDCSICSLSLSDSSNDLSSDETENSDSDSLINKIDSIPGYITHLDIASELAKIRENIKGNDRSEDNQIDDLINNDTKLPKQAVKLFKDYKLNLKPVVRLEKINFENCFGLTKQGNRYTISVDSDSDEAEIKRLINLKSLNKRTLHSSSDTDTDSSKIRNRKKQKRLKSSNIIYSSDSDSDLDDKSIKSNPDSEFQFNITEEKKNSTTEGFLQQSILEELSNDCCSDNDDDDDIIIEDKEKDKTKQEKNKESDKNDESSKQKDKDDKSNWRKNKLLVESLTIPSDSDSTNDTLADEYLKKEEEKYLQNTDKEKIKRKRSSENDDNDAIILSDDEISSDSDTSDILFVSLKRSRESDEDSSVKNKKGRKNIREVLDDSELQEETKKADKEEAERKERLTLKQKTLETVLSESQLSQEEIGFVLEVDEVLKQPIVTVHHSIVPPLKEHQKQGIKFMWDVCFESVSELKKNKGAGCILAHCMGLGKTMQVVALSHTLLTHSVTNVKRILIVCPLSTVYNWQREFENTLKVCSEKITICAIRRDYQNSYLARIFEVKKWYEAGGILILGYESFQALFKSKKFEKSSDSLKTVLTKSLIDPGPDLVVCDEGHMLKNGKTVRFASLSRVKTMRRIILTGTPLQNNLIEYYHMVNFVKPHLLGTIEEYKNRFVNPILNGQYEDSNVHDIHLMKRRSHILHKKLETTVQRFEESELMSYLPPKFDYVLHVQLSPLQIKLYETYLQMVDSNMRRLFKNYHALQNIWTHPALLKIKFDKKKNPTKQQKSYDEDFVQALDPDSEDTGLETEWFKDLIPDDLLTNVSYGVKMEILFSIIKESESVGDKLLVFSSSIDELDLIESFLKKKSRENWIKRTDYYRMDGTVSPGKRAKYCTEFNDTSNKKARLFLVSHKVGGLGLNLTAANRVVLMDVSWNPAYDIQSVFRIYRFGQTKSCYIYRLVSMGTMEEVVYSRAVTKLAISGRVVDEHQIKRHFNSDDLQRMYTLKSNFPEPPTPTLPSDRLLAKLWEIHKPNLYKFCDHKSLLENQRHEELNEAEREAAWEEYREIEREKQTIAMIPSHQVIVPGPSNYNFIPNDSYIRSVNMQQIQITQPNENRKFKPPNKLPFLYKGGPYIPHTSLSNNLPSTSSYSQGASIFPNASTSNSIPKNLLINKQPPTNVSNNNYIYKDWKTYSSVPSTSHSVTTNITLNRDLFYLPNSVTTNANISKEPVYSSSSSSVSAGINREQLSNHSNSTTVINKNSLHLPRNVPSNISVAANTVNKESTFLVNPNTNITAVSNTETSSGMASRMIKIIRRPINEQKENIERNVNVDTIAQNLQKNGVSIIPDIVL